MLNSATEKTLSKLLMFGSALVTIVVIANAVTDPVNVTKLLFLGPFAFGTFLIVISNFKFLVSRENRLAVILIVLFIALAFNAVIQSDSPFTQNLYGSYGRNTGFISYLLFCFLFLAALLIRNLQSYRYLLSGLFFAGVVNVLYCLWAWQIGDFIGWNNPYNTILGTFGNPNFIGAFLGIFVSIVAAIAVRPGLHLKWRLAAIPLIVVIMLEIDYSNAVQGLAVSGAGFALVGFYVIRAHFSKNYWLFGYCTSVFFVGLVALMGALQKGPWERYIYKTSVSLRGEYWQAGWKMGNANPFTGVGMDSYGDWYRRVRDESAMILPGPHVVTNAAHNVPFDLLAYGGWFLFITYLAIFALSLVSIIRVTIRSKKYDYIFVSLAVGWACYQIQSIISINQIGLAIWGWLLSGAVISYEIATRGNSPSADSSRKKSTTPTGVVSPQLLAGVGMVIGLFLVLPPFNADSKWRSALVSGDVTKVEAALQPGYLQPLDSYRLASAVQLLESNKLFDLSYKYAKVGIENNPNYFDAWRLLYFINKSTEADKKIAVENMKRLDPLNKDVLATPPQ